MKLTRRQEEFITKLIDLSDEFDGPIHYSILAERLGVSRFTAYDMLCLLEEKGWVASEYQLAADKNGPGRAERLFYPEKAIEDEKARMVEKKGSASSGKGEGNNSVLTQFQSGESLGKMQGEDARGYPPDLDFDKIFYCVEIMKSVALHPSNSRGLKMLIEYLPQMLPAVGPKREDLSLLGGAAFGILAQKGAEDEPWIQNLFGQIQRFIHIVLQLNTQECEQLARALSEVFGRLMEQRNDR